MSVNKAITLFITGGAEYATECTLVMQVKIYTIHTKIRFSIRNFFRKRNTFMLVLLFSLLSSHYIESSSCDLNTLWV